MLETEAAASGDSNERVWRLEFVREKTAAHLTRIFFQYDKAGATTSFSRGVHTTTTLSTLPTNILIKMIRNQP